MATYSFRIKKGKFQLDLSTTDKELLISQFELWVKSAKKYVHEQKAQECKNLINQQIKTEEEITKKNIEKHIANKPIDNPVIDESLIKKTKEKPEKKESPKDDLDIFYAPPAQESLNEMIIKSSGGVFDNILENSINNPKTELNFKTSPSIKKDSAFLNYINTRKIEKRIDYLLLTAYYFTQYEQKPRFTLKQLNAKLMQNIAVILDHSVLQEAINRDYIECLPDLTGLVGASEYRLTAYGEKVLLDD